MDLIDKSSLLPLRKTSKKIPKVGVCLASMNAVWLKSLGQEDAGGAGVLDLKLNLLIKISGTYNISEILLL